MESNLVNFYDLAILREVIPFLRLRYRILRHQAQSVHLHREHNVLIVAPCIVGDCLSCLPAIEAFAKENEIFYDIVVSPDFESLALQLRRRRHVFVASSSYKRTTEASKRIRQNIPSQYDLIVVLRFSPAAFELIRDIKCQRVISSDFALLRYIAGVAKSSLLGRPVVQTRSAMYEVLKIRPESANGHLPIVFTDCNGKRNPVNDIPALQGTDMKILVHPGSGWRVKLWSDDRWVGLIERINSISDCRFIFVGRGEVEKSTFQRIQSRLDFRLYSLINALNLWELFQVMKQCDVFIGIDSGPRNLAHLADLRSITLLNPAAVKNFMPYDDRDIVVERPNRFPANIVNTRRGANLSNITENEVFEAYERLLIHVSRAVRTLN